MTEGIAIQTLSTQTVEQIIQDYRARNEALQKRVKFLEMILEQRTIITKKDFGQLKPYFDQIKVKILGIFQELSPGSGLTSNELEDEFRRKYSGISTVHLYRRARELCSEDKLWSCPGDSGSVRFYLKLKEGVK